VLTTADPTPALATGPPLSAAAVVAGIVAAMPIPTNAARASAAIANDPAMRGDVQP
jgi:hypothetical protein